MNVQRYTGEIRLFAGLRAPAGWAFCDGRTLPVAQNLPLFQLIHFTYGGDGQNFFAVPDLRGRMPIGYGKTASGFAYQPGEIGGVESVTLTLAQFPKHTHNARCSNQNGNSDSPANNYWAKSGALQYNSDANTVADLQMNGKSIQSEGKGLPHNNMPPYFALNFIICINGAEPVFPV